MPGLLKLNPMAAEFKLNPTAIEFVPSFGSGEGTCTMSSKNMEDNEQTQCQGEKICVDVETSRKDKPSASDLVPRDSFLETGNNVTPYLASTSCEKQLEHNQEAKVSQPDYANHKITEHVHREDIRGFRNTLPKIVSGENLAEMELQFEDMILTAPLDESAQNLSQDDLNPLQIWCGEEPPQLVWSRSTDGLEELEPELDHSAETASAEMASDNQILSSGSAEILDSKAQAVDSIQQAKSKVTVEDFEILCKVGEVRLFLHLTVRFQADLSWGMQGGFGKVFQVRKKDTKSILAMKCMRKDCVLKVMRHQDSPFACR